jgi:hypothetical protein
MKNLDLNGFGVQEMNAGEMREVQGGTGLVAFAAFVGFYYALEFAGNPSAHIKAFMDGWNSVK